MAGKLISVDGSLSFIGSIKNLINVTVGGRKTGLPPDAQQVVDRFQQLLEGHQLTRTQLLRMVPTSWKWNLHLLSDSKALLKALTPDKLKSLAEMFGVREEWLSGSGRRMYHWPSGYKHPEDFVAFLREDGWLVDELRLTILAANYHRGTNGPLNQFVLVFSHPLASFDDGEHEIYRHVVFDSLMNWTHPPCRINAKIMARWFHTVAHPHGPIPIVRAKYPIVEAIAEGSAFPGPLIPWGTGSFDQFQDRVVTRGEFADALEVAECDAVIRAMDECGLSSRIEA